MIPKSNKAVQNGLALRPASMLCDEPTSALDPRPSTLDPELVGEILGLMRDVAQDGWTAGLLDCWTAGLLDCWTMVVVTHEPQFAREVTHHVAFIDEGEMTVATVVTGFFGYRSTESPRVWWRV